MTRLAYLLLGTLCCACGDAAKSGKAESGDTPAKAAGEDPSIDAFSTYKRRGMMGEAVTNLRMMGAGVSYAFEKEQFEDGVVARGKLPPSAPLTPPAGTCCKQPEGKCPVDPGAWDHPGWKAILFEPSTPHYYSYELVSGDDGFVARAVGDLDCDGKLSKLEITGKIVDGAIELSEVTRHDELE